MAEEIGLFADPPDDSHTHEVSAVEPAKAPQLVFGSAEEFLHEQLLPTYVRDVDDRSAKWRQIRTPGPSPPEAKARTSKMVP